MKLKTVAAACVLAITSCTPYLGEPAYKSSRVQGARDHYETEVLRSSLGKSAAYDAWVAEGRRALRVMDTAATLRRVSQDLAMVLSSPALAKSFQQALRELDIPTGYLAVSADEDAETLRPLIAIESGAPVEVDGASPTTTLMPTGRLS